MTSLNFTVRLKQFMTLLSSKNIYINIEVLAGQYYKKLSKEKTGKIKINNQTERNIKLFYVHVMRNHVLSLQLQAERKYYREQLK